MQKIAGPLHPVRHLPRPLRPRGAHRRGLRVLDRRHKEDHAQGVRRRWSNNQFGLFLWLL